MKNKLYVLAVFFFLFSAGALAQVNITNALGEFTNLTGGETDQVVFAFSVDKDSGSPDVTDVTVSVTGSIAGALTNLRLYRSTDETFSGGDVLVGSLSEVSGNDYSVPAFAGVAIPNNAGDLVFFVVADVDALIQPTASFQFTVTGAQVITTGTESGSASGPTWNSANITQLTATLVEEENTVPASTLAGTANVPLMGFRFTTNGPTVTNVTFTLNLNTTGSFTAFRLVESTNNSFDGGEPTEGTAVVTPGASTTIAVSGITSSASNWYFLIGTTDANAPSATVQTTLTSATPSSGYTAGTGFTQSLTLNGQLVSFTEQESGLVATALAGTNDVALLGWSYTQNAAQTFTGVSYTLNINTTGVLSNFELIESTTSNYTGAGTPVGSVVVTPGASTTVAISTLTPNTSRYYFLRADIATGAADMNITTTLSNATVSPGTTNLPFSQVLAVDALEVTLTEQTSGVPSTLVGGATNQALIGFSYTSTGPQTVTAVSFSLDANTTTLLSGFELIESNTSNYTGAGTPVGSVTVTPGATTTVSFATVTSLTTKYYFLVADVNNGVTDGTTITTTLTSATAAPAAVLGAGFTQAATTDQLEAVFTEQTGGVSPTLPGGTTQALIGFSFTTNGTQTISVANFSIDANTTTLLSSFQLIESNTSNYTGAGTPVGTVTPTTGATTTLAATGLNLNSSKYYFLVATVATGVSDGTVLTTTFNSVTVTPGIASGLGFTQASTTDALEAVLAEQIGGVPANLVGGSTSALIGFNFTTNGSQTISTVNYSINTNTTLLLSGFQLIESATAIYNGTGTPVGSVVVTPGATTTVAVSGLTASTSNYYFLVANVAGNVVDGITIQTTLTAATATPGIVSGTGFSQSGTTDALEGLISEQTGGVPANLIGGEDNVALIGFSFTSNGTQTINSATFNLNANTTGILSGFQLIESNTASYTGAGTPVGSVNAVPGPTTVVTVTGLTAITTKYYFLVANVDDGVSTGTAITTTFTATTQSGGTFTGLPIAQTGTTERLTANIVEQTSGLVNPVVGGDNNRALIGFSFSSNGTQTLTDVSFSINANTTGVLSGFELIESNTANYTGAGTPVGVLTLTPGVSTTVAFASVAASTTKYYFLIADVNVSASAATLTTQLVSAQSSEGFTNGLPFSQATTIDPLALSVTPISASPVVAGANPVTLEAGTTHVLTGFSIVSNGTQVLSTINFNLGGLASQFSDISLYRSTDGTIGSSLITADADGNFDLSALGAGVKTINSTPTYYFLRATVQGNADPTSATATVQPTDANIIPATGDVNTFSINRSFNFRASQATTVTVQYAGQGSLVESEYDDQTAAGANNLNDGNTQRLFAVTFNDNDNDTQPTTINSLTFNFGSPGNLRGIALFDFDGVSTYTKIASTELDVASNLVGNAITFTGPFTVNDQSTRTIAVQVTFASPLTDNAEISVQLNTAPTDANNSGLAAFANIRTTVGNNVIDIDATQMTFSTTPAATPDTNFDWPVYATDVNGFIDTDWATGTVTLTKSAGSGTFAAATGTRPFVAGVASGFAISVNAAGLYTIKADHSGAFSDIFGDIDVISLGVIITGPANQAFCIGGTYKALTNIVLTESDEGDFVPGGTTDQSFSMILPAGFEFNTAITPTPAESGSDITNITAVTYPSNSIVRFTYRSGGLATLDAITISGLQVKYTGSAIVSNQPILRIGGSANQLGNTVDDGEPHGTLSSNQATIGGFGFGVDEVPGNPEVNTTETRFSKNSNAVKLVGTPTGGTFSGNGVAFSAANGYVFDPNLVGDGTYSITYTYTDPGAEQCRITTSKNFTVYSTVIANLNEKYCNNSAASTGLNITQAQIDARFGPGYVFHHFVYYKVGFGYTPIAPTNTTFDPSLADYQASMNTYGRVYIYYMVRQDVVGSTYASPIGLSYGEYQTVIVNQIPNVSFSIPSSTFCSDNAPVLLTGTPSPSGTDNFSGVGVTTSSGSWFFSPSTVGASSTTVNVTITYNHTNTTTTCSNSSQLNVTVNPRPGPVPGSDITSGTTVLACKDASTVPTFSGSAISGTTYRWYTDAGATNLVAVGNNFDPTGYVNKTLVGSTQFYVTRTILGCESTAPLSLTATITSSATVEAGNATSICNGDAITLTSLSPTPNFGGSATTATWSVVGGVTGTFKDINDATLTAPFVLGTAVKYVPSSTDIQNQSVQFSLTTDDPGGASNPCPAVTDFVTVAINSVAVANAGTNKVLCAGEPVQLNGSIAGAATTLTWYKNSISLANELSNSANYEYVPSQLELDNGASINFILLTNDPAGPCGAAQSTITVDINKKPYVEAGADFTVCAGDAINLSGSKPLISSATSATWTGGLGTINSPSSFVTAYTPHADELQGGPIIFTLTSDDPAGPCAAETDNVTVTVNQRPAVTPTSSEADNIYCAGEKIFLNGTVNAAAVSGTWYKNSIAPANSLGSSLSFEYLPTAAELTNGATINFILQSQDPTGPCPAVDASVSVQINQKPLVSAGADLTKCANDVITLNGSVPSASSANPSLLTWTSNTAGTFSDANALNTQFNPTTTDKANGNGNIILTLTSNDPDGPGNCPVETSTIRLNLYAIPPAPDNTSPKTTFCQFETPRDFTAQATIGGSVLSWYKDAGLSSVRGTGTAYTFDENTATVKNVPYYVTQTAYADPSISFAGCQSPPTTVTLIVNPLPQWPASGFTWENKCFGDKMNFTSTAAMPGGVGSVTQWGWSFGDGLATGVGSGDLDDNDQAQTHGGKTDGTFANPLHEFAAIGTYNVRQVAVSDLGCSNEIVRVVEVGANPVADFTFNRVCEDDVTQFFLKDILISGLQYAWDFDDDASSSANTSTAKDPTHQFTEAKTTYNVSVTVTTSLGCTDTRELPVSILPYIKQFPYVQPFKSEDGWVSEGFVVDGGVTSKYTSWDWGQPSGVFSNDTSRIFFTNGYRNNERSVLNGPCFDMTKLERPVLSMDFWNNTDFGADGAYIEYATNEEGDNWRILGNTSTGQNWYNRQSVLGLSPLSGIGQVNFQFGWTGNSLASGETSGWEDARISLDEVKTEAKLRIRIVFGSNGDNPAGVSGFAVDNFAIRTRNRTLLAENFTNQFSTGPATTNNTAFRTFRSNLTSDEIVRIQYHTSIGGADPIHDANREDPNARAAFYGLTASFMGYLDGVSKGPFTQVQAFDDYFSSRSLVTSPVKIDNITTSVVDGWFRVNASITTLEDIDASLQPFVHVAILERQVNNETFVLRKLLPTASGVPLTALSYDENLRVGQTQLIEVKDDLQNVVRKDMVAVVVFVQNLKGDRAVLQTKLLGSVPPPAVVTGLELGSETGFQVYPNPADQQMTIILPENVNDGARLRMFDQVGKIVDETKFDKGELRKTISTNTHTGGVYLLQVETAKGILTRKVMILHGR